MTASSPERLEKVRVSLEESPQSKTLRPLRAAKATAQRFWLSSTRMLSFGKHRRGASASSWGRMTMGAGAWMVPSSSAEKRTSWGPSPPTVRLPSPAAARSKQFCRRTGSRAEVRPRRSPAMTTGRIWHHSMAGDPRKFFLHSYCLRQAQKNSALPKRKAEGIKDRE